MKKKRYGLISLVLAIAMSFCVVALMACTDKNKANNNSNEDNNNIDNIDKVLDTVELELVGSWINQNTKDIHRFTSDGMYSIDGSSNSSSKFFHDGDGDDSIFGHYYIIKLDTDTQTEFRLYDFTSHAIYLGSSYKPFLIESGHSRTLHHSELRLLGGVRTEYGKWQDVLSKSKQYIFGPNGTVDCTSWQSDTIKYFYIKGEGTHSTRGHYYVYTFPDTGLLDWRIYSHPVNDDDAVYAYQNVSGAKVAAFI